MQTPPQMSVMNPNTSGIIRKSKRKAESNGHGNADMKLRKSNKLNDLKIENIIVLGQEDVGRVTRSKRAAYEKPITMEEDCPGSENKNVSRKIFRKSKEQMKVEINNANKNNEYFEYLQQILLANFCTSCKPEAFESHNGSLIVTINGFDVVFAIPSPQVINIQEVHFNRTYKILPSHQIKMGNTNRTIKSRSLVFANLRKSYALYLLLGGKPNSIIETAAFDMKTREDMKTMKSELTPDALGNIIFGEPDESLDASYTSSLGTNVTKVQFALGQNARNPQPLQQVIKPQNTMSIPMGNNVSQDLKVINLYGDDILTILNHYDIPYHHIIIYDVDEDVNQKLLEVDVEALIEKIASVKDKTDKNKLKKVLDRHYEIRHQLNDLADELSKKCSM